ncbi:flagellar motor protein [Paenibacillus timonensis]|uniref:Flagellar motor protein n=1 Tax=Paenibacillus timonensis TaxID=225915 RepID=A0ABW3S9Z1_9BACL|nr:MULTISPECIES: flagellar motor protein [Paenibacillus]MCH1640450.1 flagellar motor protein [Paenibacillus timonensis]MDU2243011.1 flagellar motor protein [Paenibacillus sp.]
MDIATLIGIIVGLAALVGGFMLEGGQLGGLLQITAALIVFGGTFAAVLISFPVAKLRTVPKALALAFMTKSQAQDDVIEDIVGMSSISRREGVLALEKKAAEHQDPFLREGIQLVVDGTERAMVRQIMELEIDAVAKKYDGYAKIFESAGGYAPTMGIIGTVMGLIHVLGSLSEPTALGPSIALAFTATLYGVASANLIFLPIASKIKSRCDDEIDRMDMMLEGILSIQNGDHPLLVRRKLESFTAETTRLLPEIEPENPAGFGSGSRIRGSEENEL